MTILLSKSEPLAQMGADRTALWYVRVTATVSGNVAVEHPSNIFVYQVNPVADRGDLFCAVCSASNLRELPGDKGHADVGAYYRSNTAEFLCRSHAELAEVWDKIQSDAKLLARDWSKLAAAAYSTEVTITA